MDHIVFYTPLSFFPSSSLLLLLNIHTHSIHINGIIIQHMTVSILIHQQQREKERESAAVAHMLPRTVRVPSLDKNGKNSTFRWMDGNHVFSIEYKYILVMLDRKFITHGV